VEVFFLAQWQKQSVLVRILNQKGKSRFFLSITPHHDRIEIAIAIESKHSM
jgi:hypothetical protein